MKNFKHLPCGDYSGTFLIKALPELTPAQVQSATGVQVDLATIDYGETAVFRHASGAKVTLYSCDGVYRIGGAVKEHAAYAEFEALLTA